METVFKPTLQQYIEVQVVHAEPKKRYSAEGYRVVSADMKERWVSKEAFEHFFLPSRLLSYGLAHEALCRGSLVRRAGWPEGDYLHLRLGGASNLPLRHVSYSQALKSSRTESQWIPTNEDLLAKDWQIGQSPA